jgi:hypothetical protein
MGTELITVREPDTNTLGSMLRFRRPEGSKTERYFIKRFLMPLGVQSDKRGNMIKAIGENPSVLWSCHTDTVHTKGGADQTMSYKNGIITLTNGSKSNCLGADDTAGVWLMREMMLCNIPGLYVFHRGEEKGGIGSRFISENTPAMLSNIKHAIAFDRKGTDSVITHQWSGRCCSDDFAKEIGKRLGSYKPDDGGSFTDTANYMRLVPECTNLSVGYRWEHSKNEELNVVHLLKLRKAIMSLNMDGLPVARDKTKHESKWSKWGGNVTSYRGGSYYGKSGHGASRHDGWCADCYRAKNYCQCDDSTELGSMFSGATSFGMAQGDGSIPWDVSETIRRNPDSVIKMMLAYGWTEEEILSDLYKYGAALAGGR